MEAAQPCLRVIPVRCAPKRYPCPTCGQKGRRKDTHTRRVRDIAYREIVLLEITVGEYRATCGCCKTFRSHVEGVEPCAEYSNRNREAVLNRLLDDILSMERLKQAMQRDFLIDLSDAFCTNVWTGKFVRSIGPNTGNGRWNNSPAICASTKFPWAIGRCCWPPILSAICPWSLRLGAGQGD